MRCAYCFKEQDYLIEVHEYAVCDWHCGMELHFIMQKFYDDWKTKKLRQIPKKIPIRRKKPLLLSDLNNEATE